MAHGVDDDPGDDGYVVAEFPDAEGGQEAVLRLEGEGVVDADRVSMKGLPNARREPDRRRIDVATGEDTGSRAALGGIVGAVVGASLGLGITLLLGVEPRPAAPLAAMVGLAAFLGAAGFFYAGASRIPVTEGALEGPAASREGSPVRVVIRLGGTTDEAAVRPHLEASGAERIERVASV